MPTPKWPTLKEVVAKYLHDVVQAAPNIITAALAAGLDRDTLSKKIDELHIPRKKSRRGVREMRPPPDELVRFMERANPSVVSPPPVANAPPLARDNISFSFPSADSQAAPTRKTSAALYPICRFHPEAQRNTKAEDGLRVECRPHSRSSSRHFVRWMVWITQRNLPHARER